MDVQDFFQSLNFNLESFGVLFAESTDVFAKQQGLEMNLVCLESFGLFVVYWSGIKITNSQV